MAWCVPYSLWDPETALKTMVTIVYFVFWCFQPPTRRADTDTRQHGYSIVMHPPLAGDTLRLVFQMSTCVITESRSGHLCK